MFIFKDLLRSCVHLASLTLNDCIERSGMMAGESSEALANFSSTLAYSSSWLDEDAEDAVDERNDDEITIISPLLPSSLACTVTIGVSIECFVGPWHWYTLDAVFWDGLKALISSVSINGVRTDELRVFELTTLFELDAASNRMYRLKTKKTSQISKEKK